MLEHPDIAECAVVGVEDEHRLVKPRAYVVLREGTVPTSELEQAIKEAVRLKLAHYKCPRWIEFIDSLPKTATGKIQRFKLRERADSTQQGPAVERSEEHTSELQSLMRISYAVFCLKKKKKKKNKK